MGRNSATINYAAGSLTRNTFNMYLCGSALLSSLMGLFGLATTGTISGAISVALDFFISKFTPFPLNELLVAGGPEELLFNIAIAIGVGVLVSSSRYWLNPGNAAGF